MLFLKTYSSRILGLCYLLFSMLQGNLAFGQTDTLFWFVAPDAVVGLGEAPVTLHLSAGQQGHKS